MNKSYSQSLNSPINVVVNNVEVRTTHHEIRGKVQLIACEPISRISESYITWSFVFLENSSHDVEKNRDGDKIIPHNEKGSRGVIDLRGDDS